MSPQHTTQAPDGDSRQRRCVSCGYNLQGLEYGALCPECGYEPPVGSSDVSLDMAAPNVVYGVAWRTILAVAVCVVIAPTLFLVLAFTLPEISVPVTTGVVIPIVSWLFTKGWSDPAAIFNDLGERDTLLRGVRWGSAVWLVFGVLEVLLANTPSMNTVLQLSASVAFTLGIVQLTLLGLVLERWGRWTRDETAESLARFLMFAMVIVLIGTIGGIIVQFVYRPSADLTEAVSGLVTFAVGLGFLVLTVKLGSNGVMAVYHLHLNRSIDRRREERRIAHEEEIAERSARTDMNDRQER